MCEWLEMQFVSPTEERRLVNNAGISYESKNPARRTHETPEEAWDITIAVNGKSVWLGCKYVLAQMVKQEPHSSGDRGWIINLSSIYGLVGSRMAGESRGNVGLRSRADSSQHATRRPKAP